MKAQDDNQPVSHAEPCPPAWRSAERKAWWSTMAMAWIILICLDWILARVVWLPFYCGLFFFMVAGLIAGGMTFRVARTTRPMSKLHLIRGIALLSILSTLTFCYWEYQYVASTIGTPPKFSSSRNVAMRDGQEPGIISRQATQAFKKQLASGFEPGGLIGYVLWAIDSGEMELQVLGATERVSIDHHGMAWVLRTTGSLILLMAGLWLSFESLRSPGPVSNILLPGEEYEEID